MSDTNGANLGAWPGAGGNTGVAAGDAICQSLATAAHLGGTFKAWLSDGNDDAYCRIHGLTGKKADNCGQATLPVAAGPWVRMDGAAWAAAIDAITLSTGIEDVRVPLLYDENAAVVSATARCLATGTNYTGAADTHHCAGWTSSANTEYAIVGTATSVGLGWTSVGGMSCESPNFKLLCMQTGTGPALPVSVPTTARKAFVTSTQGSGNLSSWAGAGTIPGVAAGDAICQSLATAAGLANASRFKAWLGFKDAGLETGPGPIDRLTSNGPWERIDGVRIANDLTDLGDDSILTGLDLDENGNRVADPIVSTWTGDHRDVGASTDTTCTNWTSNLSANKAYTGSYIESYSSWSHQGPRACDGNYRLYCFED